MIVDLDHFVAQGRPRWEALGDELRRLEIGSTPADLASTIRLHHLYRRAAADLARLDSLAHAPAVRAELEALVARAYAEIHAGSRRVALRPLDLLLRAFPRAVRRRSTALLVSIASLLVGSLFGAGAMAFDPDAKPVLIPFEHLAGDPAERVRVEEETDPDEASGGQASFSAFLATHNTRVAIGCLALGLTWGLGTLLMLFFNGVILGAVAFDYLAAGQATFLLGWLLPHGSIEIPAILIAGQAGLVLAGALIGRDDPWPLGARLRAASSDVACLACGFAVMLVWAGLVESFISQTHEPAIPYAAKIALGVVELGLLGWWLLRGGAGDEA